MKRFFEYLGIGAIILFSFYYTEKAALLVQSKSPIMQAIKEIEPNELIKPINAIIENDTIIPGLYGSSINVDKSFLKMKDFGTFNEYYLIYDSIKPEISLENHKDKIIIKGNKSKKAISLIIDNNIEIANYFTNNKIDANILITENNYNYENLERINNENQKNKFENVESILNKEKTNKNICVLNDKNKNICLENKKYLLKPTHTLNANNYIEIKNNLTSGSIILISSTAKLEEVLLLIKQINYQDLSITPLSHLISEK